MVNIIHFVVYSIILVENYFLDHTLLRNKFFFVYFIILRLIKIFIRMIDNLQIQISKKRSIRTGLTFFENTQARRFIGFGTRSVRSDARPLSPKIIGNCRNDNIVPNNNAKYLHDAHWIFKVIFASEESQCQPPAKMEPSFLKSDSKGGAACRPRCR